VKGWEVFATVMGAATAALLGLLFVAVSIRIEPIARSVELRSRSSQTLSLLLAGLIASALVAVPDQSNRALGAELLLLALVVTAVSVRLDHRAGSEGWSSALARVVDTANPTTITCTLLLAAAVVLLLDHEDGIYVLVPALIAVLVGGVLNAWLILVRLTD
jgi:divalent metal cation (Fe/Co/Zn/Cd) transporter